MAEACGDAVRGPVALRLRPPRTGWEALSRKALFFLIRQWQSHFHETIHVLPFPPAQGFRAPEELHAGDVFARAVIADAFCDADPLVEGQLAPLLATEAVELLGRRRTSGIGGWSYFPTVIELPPDADDLAQMITLLVRTRRWNDLRDYCVEPLRVLLRDCARGDGSYETWIIPATGRDEEQRLQAEWVNRAWGSGADVEVVANLLHALVLFDRKRFQREIEQGVEFLLSRQESDGSWSSTWYWGPFYGTFAVLRLLASTGNIQFLPAVRAAVAKLTSAQRADGGWGDHDGSDPLSTALALCALSFVGTLPMPILERAFSYVDRTCTPDGGWPACPFIRMNLGRATGQVHQVLSFGSRCVTTAYMMKAAIVAHLRVESL